MEQSSFPGKLIRPARDATAIKVHSKEVSPDFRMRSIKVFAGGKRTAQMKVFQVIIADGCLFYGNDALRSRGGCCICLLMASGLTAKSFSMWVADAEEGEFIYTISSKRIKLAVFIILPRVVYTSHQCASQSEMDDKRSGGHENITKNFLRYAVIYLSRLYVGKTKGQEVVWKHRPLNWPKHLSWKNPTSSPKDSTKTLKENYHFLRSQVPNEKLSQEEQNAFQDFEAGNTDSVQSFMFYNKWKDEIYNMWNKIPLLQRPHLMLLAEQVTLLKDKISSSIASASGSPTAAETSSTLSKKRKTDRLISVQNKKFKTEMPNCGNNIQNSRKQRDILPKPTQTTSSEFPTVFPESRVLAQSSAVESPVRYTFPNQTQQSLVSSNNTMSNTCIGTSECTTLPYTETATATKVQPSVVAGSTIILCTSYNPVLGSSHEELSQTVSHSMPTLSLDSGTWSQESNKTQEACNTKLDTQNLCNKDVQDDLLFIENNSNTTDPNIDFDPRMLFNFGNT